MVGYVLSVCLLEQRVHVCMWFVTVFAVVCVCVGDGMFSYCSACVQGYVLCVFAVVCVCVWW